MNMQDLPNEIIKMIFLYLQSPEAKLIKDELNIYEKDHNQSYTKIVKFYYIKNIISFSDYYFDKLREPHEYLSTYHDITKYN
jgi:hypothetical protein